VRLQPRAIGEGRSSAELRYLCVLYSEPGTGTTLKIYLPSADADQADQAVPTPRASAERSPTGTETLLVVENEEAVRFLTRVILEKAGYRISDAANPHEAADRLAQLRPDLKVLYMSGYTGDAIVHHA
jgi:two-component system cell cycle sensor histidine kinase/response regulator CckA